MMRARLVGGIPLAFTAQVDYAQRLSGALEALPLACHNVPQEWHWANAEMDVPAKFDLEDIKNTLNRCATPELWRTV